MSFDGPIEIFFGPEERTGLPPLSVFTFTVLEVLGLAGVADLGTVSVAVDFVVGAAVA